MCSAQSLVSCVFSFFLWEEWEDGTPHRDFKKKESREFFILRARPVPLDCSANSLPSLAAQP